MSTIKNYSYYKKIKDEFNSAKTDILRVAVIKKYPQDVYAFFDPSNGCCSVFFNLDDMPGDEAFARKVCESLSFGGFDIGEKKETTSMVRDFFKKTGITVKII